MQPTSGEPVGREKINAHQAVMWQRVLVLITCYSLVVVSSQTTSPVPSLQTPIPPEEDVFRCEPITIDICMDVGYDNASFPNFRLQETQTAASTELQNFWPLIRGQCSNAIVHMLCAVYAPFCSPQLPGIRVGPCRSLCMRVRDGCEARLQEIGGFAWPPHLDCDQYNDSICFGPADPSEIEIPQSVLDQLGVTRAPDTMTPGPSPTDPVLLNVTDETPVTPVDVNITAPRSLQVFFINGSPLVEGNTVRADIMATVTGASFMCELLRKNSPPMMADCSNGSATFTGFTPGVYRLKIVASASGYNRLVMRRRVVIPRDPNYCTANLIDDGVVVKGNTLTVHFRGVGPVTGFQCSVDRQTKFSCTSPVSVTGLSQGLHHFKVLPQGCDRGDFTALPFKFTIE